MPDTVPTRSVYLELQDERRAQHDEAQEHDHEDGRAITRVDESVGKTAVFAFLAQGEIEGQRAALAEAEVSHLGAHLEALSLTEKERLNRHRPNGKGREGVNTGLLAGFTQVLGGDKIAPPPWYPQGSIPRQLPSLSITGPPLKPPQAVP